MSEHPNILIVYTDQQCYDTLGCNGNPLIRTPNLDRFSEGGIRFRRAYVNCPLCVPSRVSLFTGRPAHVTGSINNGILMRDTEQDYVMRFREAGYTSALIGKDHCFGPDRLKKTFDVIRHGSHTQIDPDLSAMADAVCAHRKGTMGAPVMDDPVPSEHNITGSLFRAARAYLEDRQDNEQPFFLWLSIPDPHPPYMVCEPYASMYDGVDVPLPVWREGEMADKPDRQKLIVESGRTRSEYPDDEALRDLKRTYWGMVSYIDDEFGRLIEKLEETGMSGDTVVVFTSDHGDYLGDHMMTRKGPHLYDSLVHVPLLMRIPGEATGLETDALVSNIDLMPTLADLAGVEHPVGVEGQSFRAVLDGRSSRHRNHVALEHGNPGKAVRRADIGDVAWRALMEHSGIHLCEDVCRGRVTGVVTGHWKYCETEGDVEELYELSADPGELRNLAADEAYTEVRRRMAALNGERE